MTTQLRKLLSLSLIVVFLNACFEGDPIAFLTPAEESTVKSTLFEAEIRRPVKAEKVSVAVNGVVVSPAEYHVAESTDPESPVRVSGTLSKSHFVIGLNRITIDVTDTSGKSHSKSVTFSYLGGSEDEGSVPEKDTVAPEITLSSPAKGVFHAVGSKIAVHGTILDSSALVKLTAYLDGVAHDLTSSLKPGGFAFEVEVGKGGLHSVAVEVTDSFGNTGRTKSSFFGGEALPSGALVPHGVGAAITAEGLDLVTEVIEAELAPEKTDLGAKLAAANPIWSGKKSIFSAELSVTSASYTGLDLSLASVAGGLKVGAKLDDLFVALKAKIKAGFTFTVSGSVTADEATLAGKVLAGKSPEGGLVFLLPSMDVSLSGFSFDIAKFPDALESLASKAVEKFLEKKLAELIRDKVPPLLERELGDLLVARSISVDGHPLDVGGSLEALGFAPTGIEAVFGTSVKATEPDPFHEPLGGFLYTPNPTLPPEHITSSMFYLAVSDDTLNQALYEAYRAGALTFDLAETIEVKGTVKDLTFGFLESYLGKDALADAGIGPSTPITLGFDAMLPPVIHFRKGAEGLAVISVHDLKLTISAGSVKLFGFELDLTLPVGIKILGDAKLSPVLYPESSKIDFRIVEEPLIDLDNDLFEPMLGDLAKAVMPSLVAAIDGFPLPKIASLSLSGVVLETHGDYLQVFADLLGEDTSGPKTSGSFSALSYNVAGLPEGLSSSSPFTYSPQISPLLNKYDLVLVQEDFFYHEQLITEIAHPFTSDTLVDYIKLYKLAPDGLNRFSRIPFSEHTRRIWAVTHGYLDNGSDALSAKGFSFARHELAPGVYLDVYNLHADAGGSAGDVAARAVQYKQLSDFIAAHSAGHAVVVGGDTNLDGFDPKDEPVLAAFMSDAKLTDVARHLGTKIEMIDRFFFRSSSTLTISPTRWRVATEFVTAEGEPLSDHPALHVDFAWKVVSGG